MLKRFRLFAIIINPDDGKQSKTFGLNILIFNLLALYIEYILQSEHYGLFYFYCAKRLSAPGQKIL